MDRAADLAGGSRCPPRLGPGLGENSVDLGLRGFLEAVTLDLREEFMKPLGLPPPSALKLTLLVQLGHPFGGERANCRR